MHHIFCNSGIKREFRSIEGSSTKFHLIMTNDANRKLNVVQDTLDSIRANLCDECNEKVQPLEDVVIGLKNDTIIVSRVEEEDEVGELDENDVDDGHGHSVKRRKSYKVGTHPLIHVNARAWSKMHVSRRDCPRRSSRSRARVGRQRYIFI